MTTTQMAAQTTGNALQILNSSNHSTREREQAIHALAQQPTDDNIQRLIGALEDDATGVRWEAAAALARMGDLALKPLLNTLVNQHDSAWLREGAYHVFYESSDPQVCQQTAALRSVLRGSAAEVATTSAAAKLLQSLAA